MTLIVLTPTHLHVPAAFTPTDYVHSGTPDKAPCHLNSALAMSVGGGFFYPLNSTAAAAVDCAPDDIRKSLALPKTLGLTVRTTGDECLSLKFDVVSSEYENGQINVIGRPITLSFTHVLGSNMVVKDAMFAGLMAGYSFNEVLAALKAFNCLYNTEFISIPLPLIRALIYARMKKVKDKVDKAHAMTVATK